MLIFPGNFNVAAPMLGANTANILLCQGFVGQVAVATTIAASKNLTRYNKK